MVFQQRNGRIDRYGQEQEPQITYLITQSETEGIKGDLRITELGRRRFANPGSDASMDELTLLLPEVVEYARVRMTECREAHEKRVQPQLDAQLRRLKVLRGRHLEQLEFDFGDQGERFQFFHIINLSAWKFFLFTSL